MQDDDNYLDPDEAPSKSQRKRDAHAQQALGERLTQTRDSVLAKLPLNDALRAALQDFKRLPNSHHAINRQLQFIGKLMRDHDTDAIAQAMDDLAEEKSRKRVKARQKLDNLCTEIIEGGDAAINDLLEQHPQLDRQKIRQLSRNISRAEESKKQTALLKLKDYLQQELL